MANGWDRAKQAADKVGRAMGEVVGEIVYVRGAHGAAELASALFNGNAYVAYGHVKPNQEMEPMQTQDQQQDPQAQTQQPAQVEVPAQAQADAQAVEAPAQAQQPEQQQSELDRRQSYVLPPKQDQAQKQQQGQRQ